MRKSGKQETGRRWRETGSRERRTGKQELKKQEANSFLLPVLTYQLKF